MAKEPPSTIKFNHKKNEKIVFIRELKLNGITFKEGAEGVIRFAGTELNYAELKKNFPDKVQNITKYRMGGTRFMPKTIKVEYSEKLFTTDKVSSDACFYEIFIPGKESVTYSPLTDQIDLLLFRVPLKFQDALSKKETT